MFKEWHMVNRFDYAHWLLRNTGPNEVQGHQGLQTEWSALRSGGFERNPSSEIVEAFLRKAGMLDPERAELLEDYRYYDERGQHRRPDVWKKLHDDER